MAPERALDVIGHRAEPLGNALDLGRRHIEKHGARVDEAADQPGTGDPVDLRTGSRDPKAATIAVPRGDLCGVDKRQIPSLPSGLATLEILCGESLVAQPGGDTLAQPMSFGANGHHRRRQPVRYPRQGIRRNVSLRQRPCAGKEKRLRAANLLSPNIKNYGASGGADQLGEFLAGNGIGRRHGRSSFGLKLRVERELWLSPRGEFADPHPRTF